MAREITSHTFGRHSLEPFSFVGEHSALTISTQNTRAAAPSFFEF
jgi:hypothetical protein